MENVEEQWEDEQRRQDERIKRIERQTWFELTEQECGAIKAAHDLYVNVTTEAELEQFKENLSETQRAALKKMADKLFGETSKKEKVF